MLYKDIDNLNLPELCELLVNKTTELSGLQNKKDRDVDLITAKQADLEMIQSAIKKKCPPQSLPPHSHKYESQV